MSRGSRKRCPDSQRHAKEFSRSPAVFHNARLQGGLRWHADATRAEHVSEGRRSYTMSNVASRAPFRVIPLPPASGSATRCASELHGLFDTVNIAPHGFPPGKSSFTCRVESGQRLPGSMKRTQGVLEIASSFPHCSPSGNLPWRADANLGSACLQKVDDHTARPISRVVLHKVALQGHPAPSGSATCLWDTVPPNWT